MTYGRVADAFVWTPVSMPGKRRRSKRHTVQGRREREFKNRWGLCSCRATQAGEHCAMSKGMLPRTSPFKAADGDLGPFSSGRRCLGAWLRPEVAQVGDPAHLGDCQRRASEDRAESRASRFYYVMRVCMVMGPRWASGRRGTGVGTRSESQRPSTILQLCSPRSPVPAAPASSSSPSFAYEYALPTPGTTPCSLPPHRHFALMFSLVRLLSFSPPPKNVLGCSEYNIASASLFPHAYLSLVFPAIPSVASDPTSP